MWIRACRAVLAAGLAVGCASSPPPPPADAEDFCVDRGSYECARDQAAMRTTSSEADACLAAVQPRCTGVMWNGCTPTEPRTDACIAALRDASRLETPNHAIAECQADALCGAAPLVSPEGI